MKCLFLLKYAICFLLLFLSVYDIRYKKIPVILPAGFGILNLVYHFLYHPPFWNFLFCSISVFLLFWLVGRLTKGQIGSGDAVVFFMTATELGFMKSIWLIYVSFLLAFFAAVFFFFVKKKGKKYEMPFVPFISLAYLILEVF